MAGQLPRCPVCQTGTALHCGSPYCPWWRCPREACRALVNYRRGVGMQHLPGAYVRTFVFDRPPPPPAH